MTLTGRLSGDVVVSGLVAGLVLILVLIGFTVTQFAFRSLEPMFGAAPSELQLRALAVDGAGSAVWEWNARRDEIKVSPVIEASLGLNAGELSTKVDDFIKHLHPADRERFRLILWSMQERTWARIRTDFRMRHADNSYRWFELEAASVPNADARTMRCVGLVRDVTDAKRAHERLLHDAVHDSLTGLPNRELMLDRLGVAVMRAKGENGVRPSVIFIDIDKFKSVNVSFGLVVGDSLLLTVARRLQSHLGAHDTLARVGGDQFAILLCSEQSPQELAALAERVRRSLRAPIKIAGQEIVLTGSLGHRRLRRRRRRAISTSSRRPRSPCTAPSAAAPTASRSSAPRCAPTATTASRWRAICARRWPRTRSSVLYQPIIYLPTEELAGFEALVRWEHPKRGLMSPVDFIPIAEQSDLIVRLGSHVLAARRARGRALAARASARGASAVRQRQHLEPADLPPEPDPGDPPHPRPQHRAQGLAAAGDHREPGDGEPRAGDRDPRMAARRRRRAGARRFRHRIFVARLSAALPLRHDQDRPIAGAGERGERRHRVGDRALDRRAWRTSSARTSSPRAWRRRRTWASCARSAASMRRASTTASRCRIARCCSF